MDDSVAPKSRFLPQGLQNLKESPARLDAARKSLLAADVKMKDFYTVTGRYDMIAICEAHEDGSLARAPLLVVSKGSITSETCHAFTEQEYRQSISVDSPKQR
jgi:uncharacterized protein with GYD domain